MTFNTEIAAFAQHHAKDMAYDNFLSHDGSFGQRMADFFMSHVGTPQDAMNQWRRDGHWNYVLGVYTQIGVGCAYNSCSDYGGYFTVDLSQ